MRQVGLLILDEVHLLGDERGPVLEVIVARVRYIAAQAASADAAVRFVALTSSLANAHDLADWLGVGERGLFNFKPSVRPVPLEVHISGHAGKHYCPRMAAMNRPAYRAIIQHAPDKPTLVFVSSRRQTRLTALDLISYTSADDRAGAARRGARRGAARGAARGVAHLPSHASGRAGAACLQKWPARRAPS